LSAAGTTDKFTYSGDAGSRDYYVYTPMGYSTDQAVPLVVVLHGCSQSPSIIAADSNFNSLADQRQCIVVYPAQSTSANAGSCWNWYDVANQNREQGEPAIIAGIVGEVQANQLWNIDRSRNYVIGLSAGAAMSVIRMYASQVF
jgi:poly(hydroxyalkanoate) depolymerase family esterase